MNEAQKAFMQRAILQAVSELPIYPNLYISDTTAISSKIAERHISKLYDLKIVACRYDGDQYWRLEKVSESIHSKVLSQINELAKQGYVKKTLSKGGKDIGRSWSFLRLRLTQKGADRLESD